MDWRTLAAWWGAALSTWLALARLFPQWPIMVLDPGASTRGPVPEWIRVRVINPSTRPLIISGRQLIRVAGYTALPDKFPPLEFFIPLSGSEAGEANEIEYARHVSSKVMEYIAPGDDRTLWLVSIRPAGTWLVILWWHRHWLLPIRLPSAVRLSCLVAKEINAQMRSPQSYRGSPGGPPSA